jgi:transformation/transcription domain-associated protein
MVRKLTFLACELRDTAESNRDFALYNVYLSTFIPALVTILGDEKTIAFGRESFDHVRCNQLVA